MNNLDAESLSRKLEGQNQGYWFHIDSQTSLDKYPAKQHARAVATKLAVHDGLIYLAGAPTTFLEDSDQNAPFRQRRYFFYLSGCDEADCHILYDIAKDKLSLYIPEINARKAVWGGAGSTKAEAEKKYDVDAVQYIPKLKDHVKKWWNKGAGKLYLLHPEQTVAPYALDNSSLAVGRIDALRLRYVTDLCRVIKDDHEIKLVRRANEVSADAHRAVLENIRTFENESQVEAIFLDTSVSEGAKNQAYNIIAGSGSNASVLHYVNNDEPLAGRQVLLIDAGAEWQCYASDVTRTFPISGHWSEEAKNIYDLVSEMQEKCIARMGTGTHFRDLQILAHFIAVTGLLKLGILHNGTRDEILKAGTSTAFFPHGLGHHVGLEVHDVIDLPFTIEDEAAVLSQPERLASVLKDHGFEVEDPTALTELYSTLIEPSMCMAPVVRDSTGLQPGMIVTVEPGIYFSQFALTRVFLPDPKHAKYINKAVLAKYMPVGGVRIEDDILITRKGYENLTTAPKGDEALKIIHGNNSTITPKADVPVRTETENEKVPSLSSSSSAPITPKTRPAPAANPLDAPEPKCIAGSPVKRESAIIPSMDMQQEIEAKSLVVAMIKSMDKLSHEMSTWNETAKAKPQNLLPRDIGSGGRSLQPGASLRNVEYPYAEHSEVQSLNITYPPLPPSPPQKRRNITVSPKETTITRSATTSKESSLYIRCSRCQSLWRSIDTGCDWCRVRCVISEPSKTKCNRCIKLGLHCTLAEARVIRSRLCANCEELEQEHLITNLVRAEDQLARRKSLPLEREPRNLEPPKRADRTQPDLNAFPSGPSNPFRRHSSLRKGFSNGSNQYQRQQPPVPFKTPRLPTKPLAYRQSLPILPQALPALSSFEYETPNNAFDPKAGSELPSRKFLSPSTPERTTSRSVCRGLDSSNLTQKHPNWHMLETLLNKEDPRADVRIKKLMDVYRGVAGDMKEERLDSKTFKLKEEIHNGRKLQPIPTATQNILRDLERNRIKSLMKVVPDMDCSSTSAPDSQPLQQPPALLNHSSSHPELKHNPNERYTKTPMSAAKFIDVHGDTFHIRFAAALVAELSKYLPNRGKLTGDEILKFMQKGTCWAGFCAELSDMGVLVDPSIVEGKDMRALGFWLGDAAVETTCGICPICLDRKHGLRTGSNSNSTEGSPHKSRGNLHRADDMTRKDDTTSKLQIAKETWNEDFYRTAAGRHFRPLWHDLIFLEEKLERERHTQLSST